MVFWLFVAVGALLVWCSKLSARIARLEQQREGHAVVVPQAEKPSSIVPVASPQSPAAAGVVSAAAAHEQPRVVSPEVFHQPAIPPSPVVRYSTATPAEPSPLMEWLKENTLIKIGAFFFFLGAVWFVYYAIAEGWISPLMRILLSLLVATGICGVGYWRRKYHVEHYVVLTALGVSIAIATVYVGQVMFSLFIPVFALTLLLGAIGYAVLVSLLTRTQWLSVGAAAAACLAPLMVNAPESSLPTFFTYLLFVSLGFLTVVFFTYWRLVTLTLAVGISLLELIAYTAKPEATAVFLVFAPLFSLIFFAASTVSMVRSNTPWHQDIAALGVVSCMSVWWVHTLLPLYEGAIVFAFALICAGVCYACFLSQKSQRLVSVYAGFTAVFVLIATSLTFDGFALTLIYTIEISTAIILAIHLQFTDRLIRLASYAFILPVAFSFSDMAAPAWVSGVVHPSALALYTLTTASFVVSQYAFFYYEKRGAPLLYRIGTSFFVLFWLYAYICAMLFSTTLFSESTTALAVASILWTLVSVLMITRAVAAKLPPALFRFAFATLIAPVFISLSLLSETAASVVSVPLPTLYFMTLTSGGLLIGLSVVGRARASTTLFTAAKIALVTVWLFGIATISILATIFGNHDMALVFKYIGFAAVSLVLFHVLLVLKTPLRWSSAVLYTLLLPVLLSLESLSSYEWYDSLWHVHALGAFVVTGVLLYTTALLWQLRRLTVLPQNAVRGLTIKVGVVAVVYLAVLVWLVAQALFASSDVAVSVALFVYTLSGLALYTFGRVHQATVLRKVGIGILALVVARLLIIDVWEMEIVGRIVTFLGVGLLFIVTALFEKPFTQDGEQ